MQSLYLAKELIMLKLAVQASCVIPKSRRSLAMSMAEGVVCGGAMSLRSLRLSVDGVPVSVTYGPDGGGEGDARDHGPRRS